MAKHERRVLIGADIDEIVDNHFKEIVTAVPETLDLIARYTMRIARLEGAERTVVVNEFREQLLRLVRTGFTVVTPHERRLGRSA
jgi:hypothetical protein